MSPRDGLGRHTARPLGDAARQPRLRTSEVLGKHFGEWFRNHQGASAPSQGAQQSCRRCLSAVRKLAAKAPVYAGHMSLGQARWSSRRTLPNSLSAQDHLALTNVLRSCRHRDRKVQQRALQPGPSQPTLRESRQRGRRPRRPPPGQTSAAWPQALPVPSEVEASLPRRRQHPT